MARHGRAQRRSTHDGTNEISTRRCDGWPRPRSTAASFLAAAGSGRRGRGPGRLYAGGAASSAAADRVDGAVAARRRVRRAGRVAGSELRDRVRAVHVQLVRLRRPRRTSRRSRPSTASRTSSTTSSPTMTSCWPSSQPAAPGLRHRLPDGASTCPAWSRRATSRSSTCRGSRTSSTSTRRSRTQRWDPNNEYHVPKDYGTTGILYRSKIVTEPVTSWREFYDLAERQVLGQGRPRRLDGRCPRHSPLKMLGYSLNDDDPARARRRPRTSCSISRRTSWRSTRTTTRTSSATEEAVLCLGWTGGAASSCGPTRTRRTRSTSYPTEGTSVLARHLGHARGRAASRTPPTPGSTSSTRPDDPGRGDRRTTATRRRTTRPRNSSRRRSLNDPAVFPPDDVIAQPRRRRITPATTQRQRHLGRVQVEASAADRRRPDDAHGHGDVTPIGPTDVDPRGGSLAVGPPDHRPAPAGRALVPPPARRCRWRSSSSSASATRAQNGGYAPAFTPRQLRRGRRAARAVHRPACGWPRSGTIACLLVGLPLAYFLATRAGRHKGLLILLLVIPFWTSFLIRTYAWLHRPRPGACWAGSSASLIGDPELPDPWHAGRRS